MANEPLSDEFVIGLLQRLMERHRCGQVYLVGRDGEPFWAARMPLADSELPLVAEVLELIEGAAPEHSKPFVARGRNDRFAVTAVDSTENANLYVALITAGREAALTPLDDVRRELAPHLPGLRAT